MPEPAGERLRRLAASVGPLRRAMAALAARWVDSRDHERLCYARLGNHARERLGVSARQVQELARVHRALCELPATERALLSNALPWSKVRLVTRVASADDEARWVALAQALPVRRLERAVKECAAAGRAPAPAPDEEDEPTTRVSLRCAPAVAEKWLVARELAERVAGERLRDGDALERVAAEAFSAVGVDAHCVVRTEPGPGSRDGPAAGRDPEPEARAAVRELPVGIASLTAGLEGADAFELESRLRRALHIEQTLDAAIAPLLRVVTHPDHEWEGEHQPLARFAPECLGMSARKARALLRLERAGDVCPELREAYREGRLSWVKAQCLLPLLRLDLPGEWRPLWVAWAERVTLRRLERDVERALLLRAGHHLAWHRCKFDPSRAQDPIPEDERQMCAHDVDPEATQRLVWRVPRDVAALFAGVRETLRLRLERARGRPVLDGEVFDAMLDCALLAWTAEDPRARRPDPVAVRDGWRCAVPGCTSRANLHDHHIRFRSRGGSDALDNRVLLCAFHHQRCLHAGRMRITGRAPDGLVFELGLRSGRAPLARYRSGDVLLPDTEGSPGAERAA